MKKEQTLTGQLPITQVLCLYKSLAHMVASISGICLLPKPIRKPAYSIILQGHLITLIFLGSMQVVAGQSSNCNCAGNLMANSTFEGGNLTGWTPSAFASVDYLSGLDGCGAKSMRVKRAVGTSLLDPAVWQQINGIQSSKTYTLSFDAGTYDPSKVVKVYLRFYSASGSLLSEDFLEINHDLDINSELESYSFSMVSPPNVGYARVVLATQGDYLVTDNFCLVKSSCSSPIFDFQNPVLVSGTANSVGAVYQFNNIIPGTHAKVTIVGKSHSDVSIYTLDEPAASFGGYDKAFQPIIDYNWINGGGSFDPAGEKSVTFKFDFVDAITGNPKAVSQINMTGLDIDGSGDEVREFIQSSGFQSYEVQNPTTLTLSGSLKAKGSLANVPNVDENALHAMISYVFNNVSSITVTYGGDYNGNTSGFGDNGLGNSDEKRHNSLYFKCYDFNNPTACPSVTVSGGKTICAGTPTVLSASMTGGGGSCVLQWQQSTDNSTWSNIAGATGQTYTTPNLNANTYYRATYYCAANAYCGVVFSNVEMVEVDQVCIEVCDNGTDDDHDGLVDCDDPDCDGSIINMTGEATICSGQSATVGVMVEGTTGPYSYVWSNGLGTGPSKTVSPTSSTSYFVTVTNSNGCSNTDQVTINVNQSPLANAGADATICRFFSTSLSASAIGGTPPYQYTWNNGLGNGKSHVVSPAATTTYTVTATSANGCNSTDQVTITVQTCVENCGDGLDNDGDGLADCADPDCGPSVDLGTDVNVCPGASTLLTASASGGKAPLTYVWSNGHIGVSQSVNPTATTVYTVTVTSASGCTATDQMTAYIVTCDEDCTNGIDDDGDGLVDCADPDCVATAAPNLADDSYMTCPGMTFSERVTYNDDNLQNPAYSIYALPVNGSVTIDATGKFTFVPSGNECTTETFMYQVCNQVSGCCSQAMVELVFGDTISPTLTNVPADVTISCDDAVPNPTNVVAFDECPGIFIDYSETSTQHYVGACGSYTITRTWIATDLCGNQTVNTQDITVVDNTKPEIFRVYTLQNGKRVVAGVSKFVTHDWKKVSFPITFSEPPMIFTTVTTNNDGSAVTVRQRNAYSQGFEMRLFEQQASDGIHLGENVSWVAIEPGANLGAMTLEAARWQNVNSTLSTRNFNTLFENIPGVIATMQSTNDKDPAMVRLDDVSNGSVSLKIHEETSADAETDHGLEHVGYLAFQAGENLTDVKGLSFGETGRMNLTNAWTTVTLSTNYTKPVVIFGGLSNNDPAGANIRVRNVTGNSFQVRLQEWDYLDGNHGSESVSWLVMEGAIPGNMGYYCSGSVSDLEIGVNVFAMDNCDNHAAFGYTETPSNTAGGTLTTRVWMAIDDCGNTNLITRFDTCSTAALQVKAMLYGAFLSNGNNGLMRDNLRQADFIPLEEPFSSLPAFPHVKIQRLKMKPRRIMATTAIMAMLAVCMSATNPVHPMRSLWKSMRMRFRPIWIMGMDRAIVLVAPLASLPG